MFIFKLHKPLSYTACFLTFAILVPHISLAQIGSDAGATGLGDYGAGSDNPDAGGESDSDGDGHSDSAEAVAEAQAQSDAADMADIGIDGVDPAATAQGRLSGTIDADQVAMSDGTAISMSAAHAAYDAYNAAAPVSINANVNGQTYGLASFSEHNDAYQSGRATNGQVVGATTGVIGSARDVSVSEINAMNASSVIGSTIAGNDNDDTTTVSPSSDLTGVIDNARSRSAVVADVFNPADFDVGRFGYQSTSDDNQDDDSTLGTTYSGPKGINNPSFGRSSLNDAARSAAANYAGLTPDTTDNFSQPATFGPDTSFSRNNNGSYTGNVTGQIYDGVDIPGSASAHKAAEAIGRDINQVDVTIDTSRGYASTVSITDRATNETRSFEMSSLGVTPSFPSSQALGQTYSGPKGVSSLNNAAQKAAVTYAGYTVPAVSYTDAELDYAAQVAAAEAASIVNSRGKTQIAALLGVLDTIRNRALSEDFPTTITDVINQRNQFEPVRNGSVNNFGKGHPAFDAARSLAANVFDGLAVPTAVTPSGLGMVNFGNLGTINSRSSDITSQATKDAFNAGARGDTVTFTSDRNSSLSHTHSINPRADGSLPDVPDFTPDFSDNTQTGSPSVSDTSSDSNSSNNDSSNDSSNTDSTSNDSSDDSSDNSDNDSSVDNSSDNNSSTDTSNPSDDSEVTGSYDLAGVVGAPAGSNLNVAANGEVTDNTGRSYGHVSVNNDGSYSAVSGPQSSFSNPVGDFFDSIGFTLGGLAPNPSSPLGQAMIGIANTITGPFTPGPDGVGGLSGNFADVFSDIFSGIGNQSRNTNTPNLNIDGEPGDNGCSVEECRITPPERERYVPVRITIDDSKEEITLTRDDLVQQINTMNSLGLTRNSTQNEDIALLEERDALVLNRSGELLYSNGLYAPPTVFGERVIDNTTPGYVYLVEYINEQGEMEILDDESVLPNNFASSIVQSLVNETTPFSIDDVNGITYTLVDPKPNVPRDEYYDFVIELKDGSYRLTTLPEFSSVSFMKKRFAEIGYSGDVIVLINTAMEVSATEGGLSLFQRGLSFVSEQISRIFTTLFGGANEDTVPVDFSSEGDVNVADIIRGYEFDSVFIYPNAGETCPFVPGLNDGFVFTVVMTSSDNSNEISTITQSGCGIENQLVQLFEIFSYLDQELGITFENFQQFLDSAYYNVDVTEHTRGIVSGNINEIFSDYINPDDTALTPEESEAEVYIPNLTNNVTFEFKTIDKSTGMTLTDWTYADVTINSAVDLHFRWDGSSYEQCLPFLADEGDYAISRSGGNMLIGNTETEGYDVIELSSTYRIECGGQQNGEFGVDAREIEVTLE